MASKTVNDFARELKLAPELLLEQLRAAGVAKRDVTDELSEADKSRLFESLRAQRTQQERKISMTRKETSVIKQNDASGRAHTIQVEVRRKRVFVKNPQVLAEEQARLEAEARAEAARRAEEEAREAERRKAEEEARRKAAEEAERQRLEAERRAAEERAEAARLEAEAAKKRAEEEAARADDEARLKAARREAEKAKLEAEVAAATAKRMEADARRREEAPAASAK